DGRCRQRDAGVQLPDAGVVPFRDFSEKDVGKHLPSEFEFRRHIRDVVNRYHGAEYGREVKDLPGRIKHLLWSHWTVTRAEENGLRRHLPNPGAGSDAVVVDLNVRMELVVLRKPLLVDRLGEGRARTLDLKVLRGYGGAERNHERSGDCRPSSAQN